MRLIGLGSGILALVVVANPAHAQNRVQDTSYFRPLDLPAPSVYRSGDGRPGPRCLAGGLAPADCGGNGGAPASCYRSRKLAYNAPQPESAGISTSRPGRGDAGRETPAPVMRRFPIDAATFELSSSVQLQGPEAPAGSRH